MHAPHQFDTFVVAAPGLEAVVNAELRSLRATRTHVVEGGVECRATPELLYTANLHLRAASRIIIRLATFRATSFAELERRARRLPWDTIVARGGRVRLRVTCRKSRLYHSDAVAERVLAAIASTTNATPDIKTGDDELFPDDEGETAQLFIIRIEHDECTISADASGAHLHKRGYRRAITQAPLRETLAAAMLQASGWDGTTPLVDPFCGSGTIPIEGAFIARRIAPGRHRRFRFMEWPDFDDALWKKVVSRAQEGERPSGHAAIVATDRSGWAMRAAAGNAERAGVASDIRFERHNAVDLPELTAVPGWIVTNPPYGVRLGAQDELRGLYVRFGALLRAKYPRWHVGILSTDRRLDALMRLPLLDRFRTSNGGIGVHFMLGIVPERSSDVRESTAL